LNINIVTDYDVDGYYCDFDNDLGLIFPPQINLPLTLMGD